ncbi:MAG: hypothetical protein A2104_04940 [Candidatus Melainabacteria bacterium GWF2_32_7]|nr:MAG: hypothetical protein A2104_04940 [Candidatus Melainabacteria bacterium GWF2_32_7]
MSGFSSKKRAYYENWRDQMLKSIHSNINSSKCNTFTSKTQLDKFRANTFVDQVSFKSLQDKPSNAEHLFVFDLDGTFADGNMQEIQEALELKNNKNGKLVYATGRTLELYGKLEDKLSEKGIKLPRPDYLITNHGQFIYKKDDNGSFILDNDWKIRQENTGFNHDDVKETIRQLGQTDKYRLPEREVAKIPDLESNKKLDPEFYNSKIAYYEYGASKYFLEFMTTPYVIDEFEKDCLSKLQEKGINSRITREYFPEDSINRSNKDDIKARAQYRANDEKAVHVLFISAADKSDAVEYLRKKLNVKKDNTIVAGNGGNDACLTNKGFWFISVGNAEKLLKDFINKLDKNLKERIVIATKKGTAGILEGLNKVFSKKDDQVIN